MEKEKQIQGLEMISKKIEILDLLDVYVILYMASLHKYSVMALSLLQ